MEKYENHTNESKEFSENLQKLKDARQEVKYMVDKLGLGIDEGIKESVAVFRALGFPTSSSCAGHTEKGELGLPYIEIYATAPEGWKNNEQKKKEWKLENEKHQKPMAELLNDFYEKRQVLHDVQIVIRHIGMFGGFRIVSRGTTMRPEELGVKSVDEKIQKIQAYQKEMAELTEFLKRKYFETKQ